MGEFPDVGLDFGAGPAGAAAGQGGGQLVEFAAGLGQGGAVEAAGLVLVQLGGMGEDRPAVGAVDGAAGVVGGEAAEPVLVDDGPGGRGHGEQVTAVTGRHRADVVFVPASSAKLASEFCPASNTTVISVPCCPAAAARAACRAARVLIISGNWVTSGLLPG